ncbi:hypothetical protein ACTXT7_017117 [Hymenolepis weldensis]
MSLSFEIFNTLPFETRKNVMTTYADRASEMIGPHGRGGLSKKDWNLGAELKSLIFTFSHPKQMHKLKATLISAQIIYI